LLKNWRSWVLVLLFFGPFLVYIGLGLLWLKDKGWVWMTAAGLISLVAGLVFTLLLTRWTKSKKAFLPPIDWDAPQTFTDFDRKAWSLVEVESEQGESLAMESLISFDIYIDTGKRLASRLAAHYHPLSTDPIERVPVIELLTALELAAEDLSQLCRQIPGGDLITSADWKRAVVAANYFQKASDFYSYLLPLFNPVTGVSRLASQHLMVKPAWKNMQQNLLRWFYRAFVNRLGTHLVELYSGRLVIGANGYRKLTRKLHKTGPIDPTEAELTIAVVGRKGSGKSSLLGEIKKLQSTFEPPRSGDSAHPSHPQGLDRFKTARVVEVDFYTSSLGKESARDRATRRHAVKKAIDSDLLILVLDIRAPDHSVDLAFVESWAQWYLDHPEIVAPPTLAVLTHADAPGLPGEWHLPLDWINGTTPREVAVREKLHALRAVLPALVTDVVVGPPPNSSATDSNELVGPLAQLCDRAERGALIRQLRNASTQSKTNRLLRQVGQQGKSLWGSIRHKKESQPSEP